MFTSIKRNMSDSGTRAKVVVLTGGAWWDSSCEYELGQMYLTEEADMPLFVPIAPANVVCSADL